MAKELISKENLQDALVGVKEYVGKQCSNVANTLGQSINNVASSFNEKLSYNTSQLGNAIEAETNRAKGAENNLGGSISSIGNLAGEAKNTADNAVSMANVALNWGNHADAGYAKQSDVNTQIGRLNSNVEEINNKIENIDTCDCESLDDVEVSEMLYPEHDIILDYNGYFTQNGPNCYGVDNISCGPIFSWFELNDGMGNISYKKVVEVFLDGKSLGITTAKYENWLAVINLSGYDTGTMPESGGYNLFHSINSNGTYRLNARFDIELLGDTTTPRPHSVKIFSYGRE